MLDQIGDIERNQLGSAKCPGEAQSEQRAIPLAGESVRCPHQQGRQQGGSRGRSPGFCFYGYPAARCLRREAGIHDNVIVGI